VLGGITTATLLNSGQPLSLSAATITDLNKIGIQFDGQLNPGQIFGEDIFSSPKGILILLVGGMLVGLVPDMPAGVLQDMQLVAYQIYSFRP